MHPIRLIHDQTFFSKINEPLFAFYYVRILNIPPLLIVVKTKKYINLIISGESGLCGQWPPDADLLLLVPGDDLPRAVLVVRLRAGHLHPGHHHLHPRLGQPRHTRPLEPSTHLVPQDVEGIIKSYQRQTKAP